MRLLGVLDLRLCLQEVEDFGFCYVSLQRLHALVALEVSVHLRRGLPRALRNRLDTFVELGFRLKQVAVA